MKVKTVQKLLLGVAVLVWGAQANAQDWAEKMFEKTSHDFGVVARGADARYRLKVTNLYKEPVHIASVTTTCGCTAAKPSKDTLASRESAYVEITMNTVKFTHEKTSSVTVVIDQPLYAEVRIPIKAWIRTDVVLTPGGAGFGSVTKGADQERKIAVAYAGRSDWKIKEVISKNPNLTAKFVETRRDGGNVNYDLVISLKGSAPLGEIRDQLTLVTDETPNPYIPLLVEGRVENEYSITPELVSFGNLNPGEKRTVNIVVKGKKPFSIEKIESEKSSGTFEVRLPKDSRPVHVVPLTVIAPSDPGTLTEEFTVTIAGLAEPVTFKAYGKIGSTTGTAATGKPGDAATAKNAP